MNSWEIIGEVVNQECVRSKKDGGMIFVTTLRDDENRLAKIVMFRPFPPGTLLHARGVLSMNSKGFVNLKSKWVDRIKPGKIPKTEEPPQEDQEPEETTRHNWLQGAFRSLARV